MGAQKLNFRYGKFKQRGLLPLYEGGYTPY